MKRQERLSLFVKREKILLNAFLKVFLGRIILVYQDRLHFTLNHSKKQIVFKADSKWTSQEDCVFQADEWPLPADCFDLILSIHFTEQGANLNQLIAEVKRTLRPDGTLIFMGVNRMRKNFRQTYTILEVLSLLEAADFTCRVERFDFWRFGFLNRLFETIFPFLTMGWMIEAKRGVLPLTPLPDFAWAPAKGAIFAAEALNDAA